MNFNDNFTKDFNRILLKILLGISQTILLRILLRKDFTKDFSRFHCPKWLLCRVLGAWKSITKPCTFVWIFGCAMMRSHYEYQKKKKSSLFFKFGPLMAPRPLCTKGAGCKSLLVGTPNMFKIVVRGRVSPLNNKGETSPTTPHMNPLIHHSTKFILE